MIAGGIAGSGAAGDRGWELTVRDIARPGQRCTTAVLLYLYGTIAGVYPVSPHPALRTPAGDLAFIALGAHSPGVGVALLQLDSPGAASADPGRTGGFEIGVPILPVAACGQRYYLGGFAYPLAGRLDLSVAVNRASTTHPAAGARGLARHRISRQRAASSASTQVRAPLRGQGHHEHHGQDCPIVCRAQNGPI